MTRQTNIKSDIDESKTHENSEMITGCFFNNQNPENKQKLVFDCSMSEEPIKDLIATLEHHGKIWVSSD